VDFTAFAADDGSSDSIGPATSSAPCAGVESCRGCRRSSPPTAATTTARLLFYSQSVGVDQQLSTSSSQGTWNISSEFVEKRVFKGVLLDVCM